jgi:hypothetical protein
MQNRLAPLRIVGFALLLLLAAWIVLSLAHGIARTAPKILDDAHAFDGNAQLPASDIQKQLSSARERMDERFNYSQWPRYAGTGADWLAFLLTALIRLLAGYRGMARTVGTPTAAELAELVKGESARFTRTVGLLAAGAAICTGLSAKARDISDGFYNDAVALQTAATSARKDLLKAPDASSAQDILDQLRQAVAKH